MWKQLKFENEITSPKQNVRMTPGKLVIHVPHNNSIKKKQQKRQKVSCRQASWANKLHIYESMPYAMGNNLAPNLVGAELWKFQFCILSGE